MKRILLAAIACAFSAAALAQEPTLIRLGRGFAAEEQVWLMSARPDLAPNQGKKYQLKQILFQANPERFQAFLAGELDGGTAPGLAVIFARAQGVEMMADFEPGLPKTMIIEHQLQQVFMNLALNALDAMHGRGKLTVRAWRNNGAVEVVFSDTGEGITPEQIQHIFEPYYTTKSARHGTGLGLALSYNIIRKHGGAILVQSEKGKGSTFAVSIPLRGPSGAEDAASPNAGR